MFIGTFGTIGMRPLGFAALGLEGGVLTFCMPSGFYAIDYAIVPTGPGQSFLPYRYTDRDEWG